MHLVNGLRIFAFSLVLGYSNSNNTLFHYTQLYFGGFGGHPSLLRRGFNELYMAFTVSNRCVEDAQAEKAGSSYTLYTVCIKKV
jgi:hypothetical protein